MDSGQGYFVTADNQEELKSLINDYPDHGGIFSVGQPVEAEGSFFKVSKITPKKITLRLLTKVQWEEAMEDRMRKLKNKLDQLEKEGVVGSGIPERMDLPD